MPRLSLFLLWDDISELFPPMQGIKTRLAISLLAVFPDNRKTDKVTFIIMTTEPRARLFSRRAFEE
jgi:hypothetical protein